VRTSENARGTPGFMAPELYDRSMRTSQFAIDVFAFGMVMYELLSGKYPYHKLDIPFIRAAVLRNERPVLDEVRWPHDLRQIMTDCWIHDARSRPSLEDIIARLNGR
jgi:serine/threonine protein kinase